MFFQVLLAIIVGKLKKYRVGQALLNKYFLPFYIAELIYIIYQINIFCGNYFFIPYGPYLKNATLVTLLIPIYIYKLYLPAFAGSGCIVAGSLLNKLVIFANDGKMPVYASVSRLTGYFSEAAFAKVDSTHVIGSANTKLKILSDFIDLGYCVISIGDILIHLFVFIIFYYSIKAVNIQLDGGSKT